MALVVIWYEKKHRTELFVVRKQFASHTYTHGDTNTHTYTNLYISFFPLKMNVMFVLLLFQITLTRMYKRDLTFSSEGKLTQQSWL